MSFKRRDVVILPPSKEFLIVTRCLPGNKYYVANSRGVLKDDNGFARAIKENELMKAEINYLPKEMQS